MPNDLLRGPEILINNQNMKNLVMAIIHAAPLILPPMAGPSMSPEFHAVSNTDTPMALTYLNKPEY